ncbi:tetratricopeptide repeat protein [Streptomyces neyagawaensis]|uniref:tetratricopeptide repeat protein n=1 Tax=Streptomyces neyagawaensis TaxID=42238 RepID=UPI0006E3B62E|nr:tetratricopeptide repeat protein [Streptomyces neyagawaensis]MCL6733044.1 sel1 repeat family protein [Streptomyces neyagawaensis]MDE1684905.1 tetratricopeptide repeat protein [Streptomyces neyagawaensis]
MGRESDEETGGKRSVEATGSRSIAAGGNIGNAYTGNATGIVIQAGHIGHLSQGPSADERPAAAREDRATGAEHDRHGSVLDPAAWQPVGEVEPLEFGVGPTRRIPGQPEVPPYVPRDCDDALRAELAHSGLVLVLGERYVGKSYTAWHGVRSLEGYRLYAPDPGEDLREVLAALKGVPGKYVVWLDELTDHLGEGGLDRRLLGPLARLGVVLLGTMRSEEYYQRRMMSDPIGLALNQARTVEVPRKWSDAELERLKDLDDPRAYPAYMWSGEEGAASYFAIGHTMYDEWRRPGTKVEHPRGQLLVRAAVDLARCGVKGAVPTELLRQVQEQYGTEERESFEDALTWATTRMFGVSGLLVAGEEHRTWRAYGALVAGAEALRAEDLRAEDLEPVPDAVWWLLLDAAEGGARIDREAVLDAARAALRPRIEAGEPDLMVALAERVGGEERADLIRRAAEAGHREAAEEWAAHLVDAGDEAAAIRYLEIAAQGGSVEAAREAGRLHRERAEALLRTAAEAGDGAAAHELGDLLLGYGRGDAFRWFVRAVRAGHEEAATSLGRALYYRNSPDAEFWLRRGAALGDAHAVHSLAAYLHRVGDHDEEAERLFREAKEAGHPAASRSLGALLLRMGNGPWDEVTRLLQEDAAQGSGDAAYWLSLHHRKRGDTDEADKWLHRAAELDHYFAMRALGLLPVPPGDQPDTVDE